MDVINSPKIRLIHHGACIKARKLEKIIDIMAYLPQDRYELNLMLMPTETNYYDYLVQYAARYANVHFLPTVPFAKIPEFTNQFDIGVFIVNSKNISYKYSLPNKFFEFVQARLAIAVGDALEMENYIKKYGLGVFSKTNSPHALADEISKLSPHDIMQYKQNSQKYAQELSADRNIEILRNIAAELISA